MFSPSVYITNHTSATINYHNNKLGSYYRFINSNIRLKVTWVSFCRHYLVCRRLSHFRYIFISSSGCLMVCSPPAKGVWPQDHFCLFAPNSQIILLYISQTSERWCKPSVCVCVFLCVLNSGNLWLSSALWFSLFFFASPLCNVMFMK